MSRSTVAYTIPAESIKPDFGANHVAAQSSADPARPGIDRPAGGRGRGPGSECPAQKSRQVSDPFKELKAAFAKGVATTTVEPEDLPKAISEGIAKLSRRDRQEGPEAGDQAHPAIRRLGKAQGAIVPGHRRQGPKAPAFSRPHGKKRSVQPAGQDKKVPAPAKEIDIPAKASKAVKAIKTLFPDAVVKQITTEVYQDPTGVVDVLTYEIEFITKGTEKEMVASPQGVIRTFGSRSPRRTCQSPPRPHWRRRSLAPSLRARPGMKFAGCSSSRSTRRRRLPNRRGKGGEPSTLRLRTTAPRSAPGNAGQETRIIGPEDGQ